MLKPPIPVKFLLAALAPSCKDERGRRNYFGKATEAFKSACILGILYLLCQTSAKLTRVFQSIEKATGLDLLSL